VMPHLASLTWDEDDRLRSTARAAMANGTPQTTYYVYDHGGQRVRKATDWQVAAGQTPGLKTERIYLGAIEIYREYATDGTTITLERETLHVTDGDKAIALVETRTSGNDKAPVQLVRYQFGNHLGSAVLELDDQSNIITYEEYFPYGSTSYQAVASQTDLPKRYRYTSKERDEENDLYYHGARYYAPWLGRWTSCDPAGLSESPNLYEYVNGRPLILVDKSGLAGEHWIDIPLLDELAKAVDAKLNSAAYAAARAGVDQKPPESVNIPVLVAKEGIQAANDLQKNPVQGAIQAADTFQSEFVAAVVEPNKNQAIAHGVRGTAAAMKFAYHVMRAVDTAEEDESSGPPGLPQPISAGPNNPTSTATPSTPAAPQGTANPSSPPPAPPADPSVTPPERQLPAAPPAPTPKPPGPTIDPRTGHQVGQFSVDPKGNTMIQPKGGDTIPSPSDPRNTHTVYPNRSNYQRLDPFGHGSPDPNKGHGHGHLPGTGPGKKGQGPSLGPLPKQEDVLDPAQPVVVPPNSGPAHWPIKK
jgi:RHS repeat-associated protein